MFAAIPHLTRVAFFLGGLQLPDFPKEVQSVLRRLRTRPAVSNDLLLHLDTSFHHFMDVPLLAAEFADYIVTHVFRIPSSVPVCGRSLRCKQTQVLLNLVEREVGPPHLRVNMEYEVEIYRRDHGRCNSNVLSYLNPCRAPWTMWCSPTLCCGPRARGRTEHGHGHPPCCFSGRNATLYVRECVTWHWFPTICRLKSC